MTFIDYSRVQPMTQSDWISFGIIVSALIIFGAFALWMTVNNKDKEKEE